MLGHSSHPDWQEYFEILVADEVNDISFTVKDDNWIGVWVSACKAAVNDKHSAGCSAHHKQHDALDTVMYRCSTFGCRHDSGGQSGVRGEDRGLVRLERPNHNKTRQAYQGTGI